MNFNKWLDVFLKEKEIDLEWNFVVEGQSGLNHMYVENVIDAIKTTSAAEQAAIKTMLVKIDFVNGNVMDYIKHLAKAIAI